MIGFYTCVGEAETEEDCSQSDIKESGQEGAQRRSRQIYWYQNAQTSIFRKTRSWENR